MKPKGNKHCHGCIFDFFIAMDHFIVSFANDFIYALKNRFARNYQICQIRNCELKANH